MYDFLKEFESPEGHWDDFDILKPSYETVRKAVTQGVGSMPSFAQSLSTQEISDLAKYISEITHANK